MFSAGRVAIHCLAIISFTAIIVFFPKKDVFATPSCPVRNPTSWTGLESYCIADPVCVQWECTGYEGPAGCQDYDCVDYETSGYSCDDELTVHGSGSAGECKYQNGGCNYYDVYKTCNISYDRLNCSISSYEDSKYYRACGTASGDDPLPPPPPSCSKNIGQSCASDSQCCSGVCRAPCGTNICVYNSCATAGQSVCQYASGCCNPLQPNAYTACTCPSVSAPSALSPSGLTCPGQKNLTWNSPEGKFRVRVNAPQENHLDTCGAAAGKDNKLGECTNIITTKNWDYSFSQKGGVYNWWVDAVNQCSNSNTGSTSVTVSEEPLDPTTIRFRDSGGTWYYPSGSSIDINPGYYDITWNLPTNADDVYDEKYKIIVNDLANGWNSCSNPYSGDYCDADATRPVDNINFVSGHTYRVRVDVNACSFDATSSDTITVNVNTSSSCTDTTPAAPTITAVKQTDADPFENETYTYGSYPAVYTRDVDVFWSEPSGWGIDCDSYPGGTTQYIIDKLRWEITIFKSDDSSKVFYDIVDISPSARSWDMASHPDSDKPNKLNKNNSYYTARVCAKNTQTGSKACDWLGFIKLPFATGRVKGDFWGYDLQGSPKCAAEKYVIKGPTSIKLSAPSGWKLADSTNNEINCTIKYGGSGIVQGYECTFNIDNNTDDLYGSVHPRAPLMNIWAGTSGTGLNARCPVESASSYSCSDSAYSACSSSQSYCIDTGNPSCVGGLDLDPDGGGTTTMYQNIYLEPEGGWFKLKNASFHSRGGINSPIPKSPQVYDSDDFSLSQLIVADNLSPNGPVPDGKGGAGAITALSQSSVNLGYADPDISTEIDQDGMTYKQWKSFSYPVNAFSFQAFKDRGIASGGTKIDSLSSGTFTDPGVYIYNGNITIGQPGENLTASWLQGKIITLVVDGNVTINENFPPANTYIAIIAKNLTVDSDVSALNGIYAADEIDLGEGTSPLKIRGNITSFVSTLNNTRNIENSFQPSLFVVFDPFYYVKLFPYATAQKRVYTIKQ